MKFTPCIEGLESKFLLSHAIAKPAAARFGYYPAAMDWGAPVQPSFGPMLNNQLNDCTSAAAGHIEQIWNAWSRRYWLPTDSQIATFYFQTSVNHGDNGAYELSTLQGWRNQGIGGHVIYKYQALNHFNHAALDAAIWDTVGGVTVSLNLPYTVYAQTNAGQEWTVVTTTGQGAPGSGGGHEVDLCGYNSSNDTFDAVSWGREVVISGQFLDTYCYEAYAVAGGDMYLANGHLPNGQTAAQLNNDFRLLAAS